MTTLDDFLKEEGIYESCCEVAKARVEAWLAEAEQEK